MLSEGEQRSFMVVYVDDILIFSPSSDLVKEVMLKLQDKFKCKALGDMSFYLGLHIERDVEKQCMRCEAPQQQGQGRGGGGSGGGGGGGVSGGGVGGSGGGCGGSGGSGGCDSGGTGGGRTGAQSGGSGGGQRQQQQCRSETQSPQQLRERLFQRGTTGEAAALGASESSLPGTAPAEALHTFTLESSASRCFFCNSTTLTPLPALVPVRLADPSGG
ncbi:unnamed protein product [Closterium sp. NIES-54]